MGELHDSDGQEGECSQDDVELLMTPAALMTPAPLLSPGTPAPLFSPGSPVSGSPGCGGDEDVAASPTLVNSQTTPALAEEEEPLLPWARPRWGSTTAPGPSPSLSVAEGSPSAIMDESELEIASSSGDEAGDDDGAGDASENDIGCESCSSEDSSENVVGVSTDPYGEDVVCDDEPELVVTCDPYGLLSEMLDGAAEGQSGSAI